MKYNTDKELVQCQQCGFVISVSSHKLYHGDNCTIPFKCKPQRKKRFKVRKVSEEEYEHYLIIAGISSAELFRILKFRAELEQLSLLK